MVTIEEKENKYIFKIKGLHQFWALRSEIIVPKNDVVVAYQDQKELHKYAGIRIGTYIPFVIIAGTYFLKSKRNFWDMTREKNTIIIELKNHLFHKLYVEVQNPDIALSLLNLK